MQAVFAKSLKNTRAGPLPHKFIGSGLPIKFNEAGCKIIEKHHVRRHTLALYEREAWVQSLPSPTHKTCLLKGFFLLLAT
jgi:hypothetical protein